jgi:hypothetical protein
MISLFNDALKKAIRLSLLSTPPNNQFSRCSIQEELLKSTLKMECLDEYAIAINKTVSLIYNR